MTDKPGTIIEVSWEVANKVGGIYTVVKTKARYCVQKYPDYLMVGPLFKQTKEFKQKAPPKHIAFTEYGIFQGSQKLCL